MRKFLVGLFAVVAVLGVSASLEAAGSSPAESTVPVSAIVPVAASSVCMMNDKVFDRPMIPVEVAGKTYFGCCEMCKERIADDESLRSATDPVSGKSVDKASAVAGALPNGRVLYFENQQNLEAHSRSLTPGS